MVFRFKDYISSPWNLIKICHEWNQLEKLSKEDMNQYVIGRLRAICKYADVHIPYYHDLFHSIGFEPDRLDSFSYYRKLPVMNKDTVRENFDRLQSDECSKLGAVICETSGSTGTPLHFYLDCNVNQASFCLFYKTWSMAKDWKLGKTQAMISGYAEGLYEYQWKTQILALSSFYLSEEHVETFYRLIKKYRPKFLRGYPSALYLFGKLLQQKGLTLHFNTIFTGAETLLPFQREFIESFFSAKVIDHYTHWERTASICNCACGKLHAHNFYGYHEILNHDGDSVPYGNEGRLVCTGLYNLAMPLLRYDTRDIAAFAEDQTCSCGSNQPVISHILGRVEDVVVTPEGRLVGRLDAAFKYSKNLSLAHIYQPDKNRIIVKIVPTSGYSLEEDEIPLLNELRKRLGNRIKIDIQKVDETQIPKTKRGKVRFVISDVPPGDKLGHI